MDMVLYNSNDQPNIINKKLVQVRTININMRGSLDEKSPILLLHDDTIDGTNYCYFPSLKRYYFINQVIRVSAKLVKVVLTTDLLMTYQNAILNNDVVITATSKPSYLSTSLPTNELIESDRYTSDFTLPDGKTMILTTIGG